jgi:hypothetical protein
MRMAEKAVAEMELVGLRVMGQNLSALGGADAWGASRQGGLQV